MATLRQWQKQALTTFKQPDKDRHFLIAHRRAGKSVLLSLYLAMEAMDNRLPNPRYLYIADEKGQALDSVFDNFNLYMKSIIASSSQTSATITFKNGATVQFKGKHSKMRGMYYDGIVVDEAADVPQPLIDNVLSFCVLDRKGWIIQSGTSHFEDGHKLYELFLQTQSDPRYTHQIYGINDTDALPPDEIEKAYNSLRLSNPENYQDIWNAEMLCRFDLLAYGGTSIYAQELNSAVLTEYTEATDTVVVLDYGQRHHTAVFEYAQLYTGFVITNFFLLNNASTPQITQAILQRCPRIKTLVIPHDSSKRSFNDNKTIRQSFSESLPKTVRIKQLKRTLKRDGILVAKRFMSQAVWTKEASQAFKYLSRFSQNTKPNDIVVDVADAFRYTALYALGSPTTHSLTGTGFNMGVEGRLDSSGDYQGGLCYHAR